VINELFHEGFKSWGEGVVRNTFSVQDVERVLQTLLLDSIHEDTFKLMA
jgi:hypothetical protein